MLEQRSTITALVAACLVTAFAAGSFAQQGAPPPAVLVQPAELTPIADQFEFIGRAAAVDKVELRARVKGFLGPRKFADGDMVKDGRGRLHHRARDLPGRGRPEGRPARLRAGRADQRRSPAPARRRAAAHQHRHAGRPTTSGSASSSRPRRNLEDAEAQLRDAEIQLSYTEIKSPIAGRIGRAAVSPGNLVSPDFGVLATVVSENPIRVLFPVTQRELLERQARRQSIGDPPSVRLKLADGSLYKEKGKLDFIDITVDPKTDGQIVRAIFDNKDNLLTDGQTVRVILEDDKPQTVRGGAAAGDRPRPDRPLSLRRRRQERRAAAARQDRHRAQRPAGRDRRAEGRREGRHPGPAARPRRHDRGAQRWHRTPGPAPKQ